MTTRFGWWTGRQAGWQHSDPLQLALYRQAWADLSGVATEDVDAVFYDVRGDEVIRPRPISACPTAPRSSAGAPRLGPDAVSRSSRLLVVGVHIGSLPDAHRGH